MSIQNFQQKCAKNQIISKRNESKRIKMKIIECILQFILCFMECPYYDNWDFKTTLKEVANQESKLESYISLLAILLYLIIGLIIFFGILIFGLLVIALLIGVIIEFPLIVIGILIIGSLPYVLMLYLRKK